MVTPSSILGTRLGEYEVQALLGSGGMARVYRGFDHNLQRSVAIKVLSEAATAQPGFVDRFRQEARLIARLRHPNIVQVYGFGVQNQVVYMVQELLPGPTLAQRMDELAQRGQRMPRLEILAVARQLAAALDAAHAEGIIHRDVKPSNALWNADGALVLTDFGIAKNTLEHVTHTQTGLVMGTPVYLSPEQAQGQPLTLASDIYALGVVLYELIGGRPPFDGDTPLAIVLKHVQTPPPPLQPLRANIPTSVEAVIQRALAKSPAARFDSAGALAQALEQAWPMPVAGSVSSPVPDIHAVATSVWQPPQPGGAQTPPSVSAARPAEPAAALHPAPAPRRSLLLPSLAALLVLVLLGGALLAMRTGESVESAVGREAAASTATPPPSPAVVAEPAGVPATAAPSPSPPAAEQATPLVQLREMLTANTADAALLSSLNAAEQALAAGDTASAASALATLQRQILQARRDGTIAPDVMRAALAATQAIADQHGLSLPISVS